MDLNEALRIADILEQDDVISPVALACRTLAEKVKELQNAINVAHYDTY